MSFWAFSHGHKKKAYSSGDILGFDLLYQMSYLSAISAAQVPRAKIFQLASKLPCRTAWYFEQVDRLARNMNYQYAEACRIVGESSKEQQVKSLLLRLSSSLQTGESEKVFMQQEAQIQAEAYANSYEGKVEALRKWTDAYVALMVAVAVIIVVAAVSTGIYDVGSSFIMSLIVVMIGVSGIGAWVIYRTAPREIKIMGGPEAQRSQKTPRLFFLICVPGALVIAALLMAKGTPWGLVIGAMGLILLPVGIVSQRFDSSVGRLDAELSTFLRTTGSTATAIGTTTTEALGRMDLRAIGFLGPAVKRLHTRLRSRIRPELCWHRLVTETGSELVNRGVKIFVDGTGLGGDAEEVGARASLVARQVNFTREKRKLVSSSFGWLSLIVHTSLVFLLIFTIEVVYKFGTLIKSTSIGVSSSGQLQDVTGSLTFSFSNLEFLRGMMIPVVIVLSLINAATPTMVDGGYGHKFFFYLGCTFAASGMAMTVAPQLANMIFNIKTF